MVNPAALAELRTAALAGEAPISITAARVGELIAGRAPSPADLRAIGAFETASQLRADPSQLVATTRELLEHDAGSWTPEQLGSIVAILRADAGTGVQQLPASIAGLRDLERIALGARAGDETVAASLRRYADAWRATLEFRAGGSTASVTLPEGDPGRWSSDQWRVVRSAIDVDRAPETAHLRAIEGLEPFSVAAAGAEQGTVTNVARRYVEAWRAHLDPSLAGDDARRAATRTLLERDPDTLQPDEWRRLAALIDSDTRSVDRADIIATDLPNLADLATRHAGGVAVAADTRRAFAAWRLVADGTVADPARMVDEMRTLVGRVAEEPTAADLQRIGALLDVDTIGATLLGPRRLPGAGDFGSVARDLARRPSRTSTALQRYADAWSLQLAGDVPDAAALREEVRSLVARQPRSLSSDDWRRLATLLDSDVDGAALRMPLTVNGLEPLSAIAARAARGLPVPQRQIANTFAAWRLGLDPANANSGVLMGHVRSMLEQSTPITGEQWGDLGAIIDLGTERTGVRLPAIATKDEAFQRDVRELAASSTRRPTPATERVLAAWRLQNELGEGGSDAVRARLLDALSPPSGEMDQERWRTLRAIFDFAGDDIDGVALESKDASTLTQLATESLAGGETVRTVEDPIIDRWRHALDPSIISERRRAVLEAMDGGMLPQGLTDVELRDLDPRWAQRTPFEKLAVEAAMGQLSGTTQDSASRLVTRVLELDHAPANMPDGLGELWSQTRRLADVNLQRLQGHTPRGEVTGYGSHPDYAQIGRIRTNIELIRRLTPPTHPVSTNVTGTLPASGSLGEVLGW